MIRKGECPFCQQRYSHDVRSQRYGNTLRYWVRCDNCGATGPKESTPANAIYRWEKGSIRKEAGGD